MQIITESAEHHFLTLLDRLKRNPAGWVSLRFSLSSQIKHSEMVKTPAQINSKLAWIDKQSDALITELTPLAKTNETALLYKFTNSDVALIMRAASDEERANLKVMFKDLLPTYGAQTASYSNLSKELYNYQKLADKQIIAAQLIRSYRAIADKNRVRSIAVRRERRDDAVILIVEDDRFTASYAANILNKEFDVIIAKTGEEAIAQYIEHAPNAVLMDIHLPGINGHDALSAIRAVDPHAFVLMLSVDTVRAHIVSSTEGGAAAFLKKPFSKERLTTALYKSPFIDKFKIQGRH
jgi:two-component system chemotaxis response regulator CheY